VLRYSALTATTCRATIHADSQAAWFSELDPQPLVLGDLAARDAVIHALQACIPHRRVLPVGVGSIVRRRPLDGDVAIVARERLADATTFTWDVDVFDVGGVLCESWRGLRLRAVGATTPAASWPVPLLAPYVERRVAELAGAQVGVTVHPGADSDSAIAAAAHRPVAVRRRHDGRPLVDGLGVSVAHVDGYTLAVVGGANVACDLETADHDWAAVLGSGRLNLADQLAADLHETVESSAARVWAAVECSRKVGRAEPETLSLVTADPDRWALLRAGDARIATYVGHVDGVEPEVALAVLVEEHE
jgi:enediyne polyketide synthase